MAGLPDIQLFEGTAAGGAQPATAARQILLLPLGTWGDVIPFVQLGRELRRRGHQVTVAGCDVFEPLARRAGLEFVSLQSADGYERVVGNPRLWHPRWAGITFLRQAVLPSMRRQFEFADEAIRSGECDVLVAPAHSLGARIAQEVHGTPLVTVHLAPYMFRSAMASRKVSGVALPEWFPAAWKRAFFRLADYCGDVSFGREVNRLRAEVGLAPARRVFWEWWNSPERVVALFPAWFARPQADWPEHAVLAGFLPIDAAEGTALDEGLKRFLQNGSPPIAFTAGTAMAHGRRFFAESLEAAQRLGRRAILLTQFSEQLPEELPPGVMAVDFVSLPKLLPRVAALVHHGGIGTTIQALAAGVPQLVVPMSFDQPDNAHRVERLGVGRVLRPREYVGGRVSAVLGELLGDPRIAARCEEVARWCPAADGTRVACDEIEAMVEGGCETGEVRGRLAVRPR
jgi:UDP:flavonoid glycosyltransferase YjiC (YdhE family)